MSLVRNVRYALMIATLLVLSRSQLNEPFQELCSSTKDGDGHFDPQKDETIEGARVMAGTEEVMTGQVALISCAIYQREP